MMEDKNNEQIKLEVQEWQISSALVGIFGLLAPAACLAIILGHSGVFLDFVLSTDHSKPKAPPSTFHRWLTTLLLWPFRQSPTFHNPIILGFQRRKLRDPLNPQHVWRDGSLLCTVVNMAVPGACKDPREHWMNTPKHGIQLVKDYFDIEPIFTEEAFNHPLTPSQEKKFCKYLLQVNNIVSKYLETFNNMRFSTDYVARGMGLVIGEQNRKSTFYIYPVPKSNNQPCDLEVYIKGPGGKSGHIVIPSILHHNQKWQQPTEYKRALYMSSKLNSISPTISGTSFLRRLSLTAPKLPDPSLEIDIRVKISSTRAKISYIPQKTGVYEIRLVTRDCHVVGSPYSVPIETPSSSHYLSNSNSESDEEKEGKYIKRKKRIISRIVDFIDEKMLLQNDGTLTKIQDESLENFDQNYIKCDPINNLGQNIENKHFAENKTKLNRQENVKEVSNEEIMTFDELKTNIDQDKAFDNESNQTNRENVKFSLNYFESKNNNIDNCSYPEQINNIRKKFELDANKEKPVIISHNISQKIKQKVNENNGILNEKFVHNIEMNDNNSQTKVNKFLLETTSATTEECSILNRCENIEKNNNITYKYNQTHTINNVEPIHVQHTHLTDNNDTIHNTIFFTPDILEKSASFTDKINDEQILEIQYKSVDPTLLRKVHDPTPNFPKRKTFSNKDPSKKLVTSSTLTSVSLVNNLVKVFNSQEYSSFENNSDEINIKIKNVSVKSSPDLVQCHIQKTVTNDDIKQNITLYKKLKSMGAISEDYDQHQCYLKDCLQNNFKEYFKQNAEPRITNENINNRTMESFENQEYKSGLVDRQKQFWNKKIARKSCFDHNSNKPKILLKESFITETKEEMQRMQNNFKPFEGIVQNKKQIFEKQISTERIQNAQKIKRNLQKSKSESFLQQTNQSKIYKQNTVSDENIEIPTIEERRNKFLQACQQSYTVPDKKLEIILPNISVQPDIETEEKVPKKYKKHSFKRKARFNRAKLFFHHLEGSDPRLTSDSLPLLEQKLSRSESDSCVSYSKSLSVSDRFQVDDLFQDILGNDKRFIGIPNKMAVVASLASLDSDSSRAEFESDGEMTLENFERKPNKIKTKNKIPGFHEEFPHIPTTNKWQYKSRNTKELIQGRALLSKTDNLNVR